MALDSEVADQEISRVEKKRSIRDIHRQYVLFVGGVFLIYGPYIATLVLQSSIAIEENVGTLALGISYVVAILVALFISPFALIRFGARSVLIFGGAAYTVYIAANFYPKKWIKIIAGISAGAGEGTIWPAMSVYLWHYGHSQGLVATKSYDVYVRKYTGIFYAALQTGLVVANAVAYGVLHGSKAQNQSMEVTPLLFPGENSTLQSPNKYQYCGANDCLDNNNTEENLDRYVPANLTSLHVLFGVFCCLCGVGLFLQACKLKKPKTDIDISTHDKKSLNTNSESKMDNSEQGQIQYLSTLLDTAKQLKNIQQILVLPMTFYYGLQITFVYSEFTRSLVSCIVGVEKVGMALMIYATASGTTSVIIPKIVGKIGRLQFLVIIALLDLTNYTFCLFWQPSENNEFIIIILAIFFGIADASWRNMSFDCHTVYFPNNTEIAYTIWNCTITIGLAVGYLWTPLFCVRTKLVIQISLVALSIVCCGLAERRHRTIRKKRRTGAI